MTQAIETQEDPHEILKGWIGSFDDILRDAKLQQWRTTPVVHTG